MEISSAAFAIDIKMAENQPLHPSPRSGAFEMNSFTRGLGERRRYPMEEY
jgi:hypothetical protein